MKTIEELLGEKSVTNRLLLTNYYYQAVYTVYNVKLAFYLVCSFSKQLFVLLEARLVILTYNSLLSKHFHIILATG